MLPITNDTAEAHSDFLKVRGDSPWDPEDIGGSLLEHIRSHLGLVIGLSVAAAALIIAGLVGGDLGCGRRRTGHARTLGRANDNRP